MTRDAISIALHTRSVILDAAGEGRLSLAIWLAGQHATELALATRFYSLTEFHTLYPRDLLSTRRLHQYPVKLGSDPRRNREAIQAAIDMATASGGGQIWFPPGAYPVAQQ